jgi:hypothetical protein
MGQDAADNLFPVKRHKAAARVLAHVIFHVPERAPHYGNSHVTLLEKMVLPDYGLHIDNIRNILLPCGPNLRGSQDATSFLYLVVAVIADIAQGGLG